ncbi:MAG: ribosome small subunit-dependent GTPase A [Pseudomonadota bacterium]|nr:ribosome small subunit-dependent GTPase A [Pseudomonadota bacterium]
MTDSKQRSIVATVTANFGENFSVLTEQGDSLRCFARKSLEGTVAGDRVLVDEQQRVILKRLKRDNVFERPNDFGKVKSVVANIDQAFVVFASEPEFSCLLLDRYLVALHQKKIQPILLLNKTDLIDEDSRDTIEAICALYESLGYPLIKLSAKTEQSLKPLQPLLAEKNSVFLGQSGVGKSSIINQLLPEAKQLVNTVSEGSKLGQHTTTTSQLFALESSGFLVDSPGIRDFLLWHINDLAVAEAYPEIVEQAQFCRFRNCRHQNEPNCAVKQAVENGEIATSRWESFQKIQQEIQTSKHNKLW